MAGEREELERLRQLKQQSGSSFGKRLLDVVSATQPSAIIGEATTRALDKAQQAADIGGEKVAEILGSKGINPNIAAGIGTGITMIPELTLAAIPGGNVKTAAKALRRTPIFAPTAKSAQSAVTAAREAEGIPISLETAVEPRTRKAILEFVEGRQDLISAPIKKLANASPEAISRMRDVIGRILDSQNVAKFGKDPKTLVDKSTLARLSKFKDKLTKTLTQQVPSLEQPLAEAAASFQRQNLMKSLGKGAKKAAIVSGAAGIGAGGLAGLLSVLK